MAHSFKNRPWHVATPDPERRAQLLSHPAGLSGLEANVLASRGLDADTIEQFLDPRLKTSLPHPEFFLDMDRAADRLVRAILDGEQIAIWSDYDVDGAASAAILGRFLATYGGPRPIIRIPDRISEGYGPNAKGLDHLVQAGATLVCVLDSGTTAFEPLAHAHARGLDVVVIDHHMARPELPQAVAVVNPNRLDQPAGFGHVCAAGMTFMLAVAADLRMRRLGRPGADLMALTGLVALATVCDVVALTGINRAFVARGLPVLSQRNLPGVAALCEAAEVEGDINARICGFGLGPRINAGGRIGQSDLGTRLLLTDCPQEAHHIALQLDALNTERRALEKEATATALSHLETRLVAGISRELALAIVDAHEGIVGISAARVKEAFDTPAFVLAPTPEGLLKGSGRSVAGFDLGSAVVAALEQGLLVKGGGHAMAAGITIHPDRVEDFVSFINAAIAQSEYGRNGLPLTVDGEAEMGELSVESVRALERFAPYGMGNPHPRFLLRNLRVVDTKVRGETHLALTFQHASRYGKRLTAMMWGAVGTPFAQSLQETAGHPVDIVCTLEVNTWQERDSVRLRIEDARPATAAGEKDLEKDLAHAVPF